MDRSAYYSKRMVHVTILNESAQHGDFVPERIRTTPEFAEKMNGYIKLSVSLLMDLPITNILDKHKPTACDARMICFYLLRKHAFLSFRKIAHMYAVDGKQVWNRIQTMEAYIKSRTYPELVTVVEAISHCIEERQRV